MKKILVGILTLIACSLFSLSAESVGSTSLHLSGVVSPKSLFSLSGFFDTSPNAVQLDAQEMLPGYGLPGVEVGEWSVSSNSSSSLTLKVLHPAQYAATYEGETVGTFNATIEDIVYQIPYRVSNGSNWVYDDDVFSVLTKTGGRYDPEVNTGKVYIQRVDSDSYPPFSDYQTSIQLILEAL